MTSSQKKIILYELADASSIGKTMGGDDIKLGGFSGLHFTGKTADGEYIFLTLTDRGPNAEPLFIAGVGRNSRPFLLPDFQPRIVRIQTDSKQMKFKVTEQIYLKDPQGRPLRGRPQWPMKNKKNTDEMPVNLNGDVLAADLMGIDPEGIAIDDSGNYWLCEEYRPSILKFSPDGTLIRRFIPQNSLPKDIVSQIEKKYGANRVVDNLPEKLKNRKGNRGFEGIAYRDGKIYAVLQSPLENDTSLQKQTVLIEFDIKTEKVTSEYSYPLLTDGVDKIGDLAFSPSGQLFALEQNSKTGAQGIHVVTELTLKYPLMGVRTDVSLSSLGYDFAEKVEGLTFIDEKLMAVLNDNDFGVAGDLDISKLRVPLAEKKTVLGIWAK